MNAKINKAELYLLHGEAFDRGQRDCAAYYAEPNRGSPQTDNYPSNPYPRNSDDWMAYNCGWNTHF